MGVSFYLTQSKLSGSLLALFPELPRKMAGDNA